MSKGNANKFKTGYRTSKSFIGKNNFRLRPVITKDYPESRCGKGGKRKNEFGRRSGADGLK